MKKISQPLDFHLVMDHRREDCVHYAGCLEEASAMLWQSFSCKNCKQYSVGSKSTHCYEKSASPLAWEV